MANSAVDPNAIHVVSLTNTAGRYRFQNNLDLLEGRATSFFSFLVRKKGFQENQ